MKNPYLKDTKKKIEKYDQMKDQIELRKKDIEYYSSQLKMIEDQESTSVLIERIQYLHREVKELEKEVYAMDQGFRRLPPVAYKIIELKYRKRESWVSVAFEVGYGQTRCKELGKYALMIIGEYLYGLVVHQDLPLITGASYY